MKITELSNLWIGYNEEENFRVLICAIDEQEAAEIAEEYRNDAQMGGSFEISEFTDPSVKFDCDYALAYDRI